MANISFDTFRTLGFKHTTHLKPAHYLQHRDALKAADWVLFPEYWQVNALVFGLGCRIFPSLATYLLGHNKVEMTRALEVVAPHNTPRTLITANSDVDAERVWEAMDLPFVVKLPKASMGNGVWLVENRADFNRYRALSDVIYAQEYLPIDRDIRVVVIGDQVLTAYWRCQAAGGFYNNVAKGGIIDHSPVPLHALTLARDIAVALGIDHAGFDIAMVGDFPYVLEFNRLFGNRGLPGGDAQLREAIEHYLAQRHPPQSPSRGDLPRAI